MTPTPVTSQPRGGAANEHLFGFQNQWHTDLFGGIKKCPDCLIACCCSCLYNGYLSERAGESFWAGCLSSGTLLAVRTKLRSAFKIRGDLCIDCLTVSFCGVCAMMQTKEELDFQGIPGHGPAWLGNK